MSLASESLAGALTLDVKVPGEVCVHGHGEPKGTILCYLLEVIGHWLEPRPQRLHEEEVLFLRELEQRAQLGRIRRHGLLAQDVLPGRQSIACILVVLGVGRAYTLLSVIHLV